MAEKNYIVQTSNHYDEIVDTFGPFTFDMGFKVESAIRSFFDAHNVELQTKLVKCYEFSAENVDIHFANYFND